MECDVIKWQVSSVEEGFTLMSQFLSSERRKYVAHEIQGSLLILLYKKVLPAISGSEEHEKHLSKLYFQEDEPDNPQPGDAWIGKGVAKIY